MNVSTVDEDEMKRFDFYSLRWWDPEGEMLGLHLLRPVVYNYIHEVTTKYGVIGKNAKLLDVGCGGGLQSEDLARRGFCVTGIDVNSNVIKVAQEHAKLDSSLTNLVYKHESVEHHSLNNPEKYDVVVLAFVLQHARNHHVLLECCAKVLKPGGLLFATSAAKTFVSWLRIKIFGELIFRVLPVNGHNWNNFFSAKDVERILNENNCVVEEAKGMYYDVFSKRICWHDDVDGGFYSIFAIKL